MFVSNQLCLSPSTECGCLKSHSTRCSVIDRPRAVAVCLQRCGWSSSVVALNCWRSGEVHFRRPGNPSGSNLILWQPDISPSGHTTSPDGRDRRAKACHERQIRTSIASVSARDRLKSTQDPRPPLREGCRCLAGASHSLRASMGYSLPCLGRLEADGSCFPNRSRQCAPVTVCRWCPGPASYPPSLGSFPLHQM